MRKFAKTALVFLMVLAMTATTGTIAFGDTPAGSGTAPAVAGNEGTDGETTVAPSTTVALSIQETTVTTEENTTGDSTSEPTTEPPAAPRFTTPVTVGKISTLSGHKSVTIKWNKVEGCSGYIVMRASRAFGSTSAQGPAAPAVSSYSKYRTITGADNTSLYDGKNYYKSAYNYRKGTNVALSDRVQYYYIVYPYFDSQEGLTEEQVAEENANYQKNVVACASKASDSPVCPLYIRVTAKSTRNLTSHDGKRAKLVVRKDKSVLTQGYAAGSYYFYAKSNKGTKNKFRLNRISCKNQVAYYVGKKSWNYSVAEAENFVNEYLAKTGVSSSKKRLIWVSYYTQRLYILNKDASTGLYKNMKIYNKDSNWDCSTGKASTPSPTGNKKINYRRYAKQVGIPYWRCFSGGNGIHGKRPSYVLGKPQSHGCIRNENINAKWMYSMSNIPLGTRVLCY